MLIENFRNYWSCIQTGTYAAGSLSIPSDLNSRWSGRAGDEMLENENVMKTGSLYMYIVCLLIIYCVYSSLSCLLYCVFFNVFTNPEICGMLSSWGIPRLFYLCLMLKWNRAIKNFFFFFFFFFFKDYTYRRRERVGRTCYAGGILERYTHNWVFRTKGPWSSPPI